jgi:hypothetical protein
MTGTSTSTPTTVAFIHRFGYTLNPHRHFHCVVIDNGFDSAAAGGVIFRVATGLDANAIVWVQAQVRRRLLRVFHLGEPTAPPRIAPARGPPLWAATPAHPISPSARSRQPVMA